MTAPPPGNRWLDPLGIGLMILIATNVLMRFEAHSAESPNIEKHLTQDPELARLCQQRMGRIFDAMEQYKATHDGKLPAWLSDLTPDLLDREELICPHIHQTGDARSNVEGIRKDVFADPDAMATYAYEFCAKEIQLWAGVRITYFDWKMEVVNKVGEGAPLLRCLSHKPYLNLSYGGKFYTSELYWESLFTTEDKLHHFSAENLFIDRLPFADKNSPHFRKRQPDLDPRHIDLDAHYNGLLNEYWLKRERIPRYSLAALPQGLQQLGPHNYDIRGVVQVARSDNFGPFPQTVTGIPIHVKSPRLHFLHGTDNNPHQPDAIQPGDRIGSYRIHFKNGWRLDRHLIYGKDVLHWLHRMDSAHEDAGAEIVWKASAQPPTPGHHVPRLFHMVWENPYPECEIQSVDFHSAMTQSAPFLVAITLD